MVLVPLLMQIRLLTAPFPPFLMSQVNASGTRHYIDTAANFTGAAVTSGTLQAGPHVSSSARSRDEYAQQLNESSSGQQFGDVLPIASILTRVFDSSSGSSRGNSPTGN